MPSSDTFDILPSTWLNYDNNIISQTNATPTIKFEGYDTQNQDLGIAISDISLCLTLSGITISPPSTANLIQNNSFYIPQHRKNCF